MDDLEPATPLEEVFEGSAMLYPNPTTEGFKISGIEGVALVTLTDMSGKLVFEKEVVADELVLINHLPSGVYIARLKSGSGVMVKKLVKR